MKATELRLWNIVYDTDKGLPSNFVHRVELIDLEPENIGTLEPIPISEKWLLRFGFEAMSKANAHYFINYPNPNIGEYQIHLCPLSERWGVAFGDKLMGKERSYISETYIKHVHQLQNLYFALTGEELTIK